MPKICYVPKRFNQGSQAIILLANEIIAEYEAMGFGLTLRQLYYQFVARGHIANKDTEYKRLGSIINDARLAGLIDWYAISDRTRNLRGLSHWETPAGVIEAARDSYHLDHWANQSYRPEVWIEKDALVGVIEGVCGELDVPFFSCRGYTSQSEMWVAAQRLRSYSQQGQMPIVFHLGDHDPSGIDMTRDITDRLELLSGNTLELQRLALNMDQVKQYDPPPNPAKLTDSRVGQYLRLYGDDSWELDALDPPVIAQLIRDAIERIRDDGPWAATDQQEGHDLDLLSAASEHWNDVASYLEDEGHV